MKKGDGLNCNALRMPSRQAARGRECRTGERVTTLDGVKSPAARPKTDAHPQDTTT